MLRTTLLEPGGQWCAFWDGDAGRETRDRANAWIREQAVPGPWLPFCAIRHAHIDGRAAPFFRAAGTRRTVVVGPGHIERLDTRLLEPAEHVTIPDGSAWEEVPRIRRTLFGVLKEGDLVLFCAGMASNVLIHQLWNEYRWQGHATLLDVGSVLDPWCGVYSRRVYRDSEWREQTMQKNLP
jgi:hypothetical protein